jgi:nitroreductase
MLICRKNVKIMELLEGLISRRSIRKYTGGKIAEDVIESIVKAGMYAPSASNTRPWHFIIIDDRNLFNKIMSFHPYSAMLADASHAILVCGDESLHNGPGYYLLDCSAATQNILLATHAHGYGAVWIGIEPKVDRKKNIREIFGLPEHIQPVSIVSIGIPVEVNKKIPLRFEPKKIRRNRW